MSLASLLPPPRCGARVTWTTHEQRGPRGGVTYALSATCRCGRVAGPVPTGKRSAEDARGHWNSRQRCASALNAETCSDPVPRTDAAALLLLLARLVAHPHEAVPMAFFVVCGGTPEAIDAAVDRAWEGCDDGEAMGEFITACARRDDRRSFAHATADERGRVAVGVTYDDGTWLSVSGESAAVARVLQQTTQAPRNLGALVLARLPPAQAVGA